MAHKKKAKKSHSYKSKKKSGGKKHYAKKSHASHASYKHNPGKKHHKKKKTYSSKKRHHKKRNPGLLGGGTGIVKTALELTGASFLVNIGDGYLRPTVSRFVPAQFAAPVSKAASGFLLSQIAKRVPINLVRSLEKPLLIMGIALAFNDLITPYIRQWISGGAAQGPQGRGMRGIGPYAGVPQFVPRVAPRPVAAGSGPQGIAPYAGVPQFAVR